MTWTADPLEERRAERERLLRLAREHVEGVAGRIAVVWAAVAGSVARGDFNLWSDVDVVLVSDALPKPGLGRVEALGLDAPPGIELHGYTTSELARALDKGDRLAREAMERGMTLFGAMPRRDEVEE